MEGDGFRRIEEVFESVAPLAGEERRQALGRLCGEDAALRSAVEALLAADEEAGDFLIAPFLPPLPPSLPWAAGRRLGAYRIERKLGEGGMGTVYLAARDDGEYERQVAVKVLHGSVDSPGLRRRFRAERQILASLDHPGIARLLDGGTTEEGRPYLVMEYIEGSSIDRWCDDRALGLEARVDLLIEVCAAVAYAHQNLVVHRDLKPSNLLVTPDGAPHLLDFGIAKLLGGPAGEAAGTLAAETAATTGERLLTPRFASPEQIAGRPVTTASDVYSLGVLLFLLLTGEMPYRFDPERLGALETAIAEQEPQRPSAVARGRRPWARRLAGDLDNIVLLALAKDPRRRYGTAELLGQDLRRFREGLPVAARAATRGYRLRKFVARHRMGVAVSTAALLLVAGLAVALAFQALRLTRRNEQIRLERDKAVAVTRFLERMFASPDPAETRGETVTAREILDRGAAQIGGELSGHPEVEAALLRTMGSVYHNLGLDDRALPLLDRSLALRRRASGGTRAELVETLEALGRFHLERGELAPAERYLREALARRRREDPPRDPALGGTYAALGSVLTQAARYAEAEALLKEALALGDEPEVRIETLIGLADLSFERSDLARAEARYRRVLELLRDRQADTSPKVAALRGSLALVLVGRGKLREAEAFYRGSVDTARNLYGDAHPEVAIRLNDFGVFLLTIGRPAEAEAPLREAVARLRHILGSENPRVATALGNLARSREDQGDYAAAQPLYEEALPVLRRTLGEHHPLCAKYLGNYAVLLARRHRWEESERLARKVADLLRDSLGEENPDYGTSCMNVGGIITSYRTAAAAEPWLRRGCRALERSLSPEHWRAAVCRSFLGEILWKQEKRREAEPLLRSGYEVLLRTRGSQAVETKVARARLGFLAPPGEPPPAPR